MSGIRCARILKPTPEPEPADARHLREANECLILATLHAQSMTEASELAAARVREANEHLVVATVHAQMMRELAEQATAQLAVRSKLELQLVDAQKLETLGLLSSGVAHDFNNLITIILGFTDLGRLAAAPGSSLARALEGIDRAAMQAGELTLQLMAYAGHGPRRKVEVDLGIIGKEVAHLFTVTLPGHVKLRLDLADQLPFIQGDPTQVFQVVMNLLTNAAEACPDGSKGCLTLRTRGQQVDAAALASGGWSLAPDAGRYATLEIADNGAGRAPAILDRILEPCFTTKPAGHGLGLAAAAGIIRGHGGGLKVLSEPGRGSSFTLFLPASRGSQPPPP